jgi:hypothetical protein
MRRVVLFLAALSLVQAVRAQPAGVSGPVEGFTFDAPTRSIRAVIGSLGSASLGPAAVSELDFASVAPRQNYGIGFRRGRAQLVSQLGSAQISVVPLQGSALVPDGVAWSDDGSVATLYSQTGSWIQTFTGFPTAVNAGPLTSMAPLGGSLSAVAADIHGAHIAIAVTGDHPGVYEITAGQGFLLLLSMPDPVALAFSADDSTLYALDGVANQVSEINISESNLTGSATQTWPVGTADAVAIRTASNASNPNILYVAGGSDHLLLAFDTSTHQQISSVPLPFAPTTIEPLGNFGFLLRTRTSNSDPLWSFANATRPMVYFVPATPLPRYSEPSPEVRAR